MAKIFKSGVIFDRNELFEDLRDDLPPYMRDVVKGQWGEEYLDLDTAEKDKIPEVPDSRVKISWDDIKVDPTEISTLLIGSITKDLYSEISGQFKDISVLLGDFHQEIIIPNFVGLDENIYYAFKSLRSEMGRDVMYDSAESLESNLGHVIKLLFDKTINSIDYSTVSVDYDRDALVFDTYDNRKSSLTKELKKLRKYLIKLFEGEKEIDIDPNNIYIIRQLKFPISVIGSLLKIIGTGALKSVIKDVLDKVDKMREGQIQPELLVSSKPDDFLRMAVSPFYTSCQELYTGSYRKQLLTNVFDTNSKIAYIIIDRPFTDCRGNQHPYTPIARSIIRKLETGELVLDGIYVSKQINIEVHSQFAKLINNKLNVNIINDNMGGIYKVEMMGGEEVYKLPETYSDNFKVRASKSIFDFYDMYSGTELNNKFEEILGFVPDEVEEDAIFFYVRKAVDDIIGDEDTPFNNADEYLKDVIVGDTLVDISDERLLEKFVEYDIHNLLFEYLEKQYPEIISKLQDDLNRPINPKKDLEDILSLNERPIDKFKQHLIRVFNDVKDKVSSLDFERFLNQVIKETGDVFEFGHVVTGFDQFVNKAVIILEGVHRKDFEDMPMEDTIGKVTELYYNGVYESHMFDYMESEDAEKAYKNMSNKSDSLIITHHICKHGYRDYIATVAEDYMYDLNI